MTAGEPPAAVAARAHGAPSALACFALLAVIACGAGSARAQVGGSVAVDSDYRWRGVTLSDSQPDARVSLSYDHPSGVYAGAMLTRVVIEPGPHHAALFTYLGYAHALPGGLVWEAGATRFLFDNDGRYDYSEVYVGLIGERWSTRLYASDNYFGRDVRTVYAEFDGNWPINADWRLLGHAGALATVSGPLPEGSQRMRYDARAGALWRIDAAFNLQFAWAGSGTGGPYPSADERKRNGPVVSLSYSF